MKEGVLTGKQSDRDLSQDRRNVAKHAEREFSCERRSSVKDGGLSGTKSDKDLSIDRRNSVGKSPTERSVVKDGVLSGKTEAWVDSDADRSLHRSNNPGGGGGGAAPQRKVNSSPSASAFRASISGILPKRDRDKEKVIPKAMVEPAAEIERTPSPSRRPDPSQAAKEDETDDDVDSDAESESEITHHGSGSGVPPEMRQAVFQKPLKKRRGKRVSICIAKCRSSLCVVRLASERLHWRDVERDTSDVSVVWLEHTDSRSTISPYQVVSKIEGMLSACRKAELAASLRAMQESYPTDYAFCPRTWILSASVPEEALDLERTMAQKRGWTYICKPTAGSQGKGVRLVKHFNELRGPLKDAFGDGTDGCHRRLHDFVVQRYVSKPLLIDGFKFDCRCYVVVTSVVPLRGYLFEEGLARFCTTKYRLPKGRNLSNACMHLTNFAVNKHSDKFSTARSHDEGSKRSMSSVFARIEADGGPTVKQLWGEIRVIAERTLLAIRPSLVEHFAQGEHGALHPAGPKGFHVLGFDVMFNQSFQPFLLELNANSSMSIVQPAATPEEHDADAGAGVTANQISELDLAVKEELICQTLLVVDPLPHGVAMRGKAAWMAELPPGRHVSSGVCPPVDEPLPLGDDGVPVHENCLLRKPRVDHPSRCPAMAPLEFDCHASATYVYAHLLAYRVWRHFAFTPSGNLPLKQGQPPRKYTGLGRAQFRRLCDAVGLVHGAGTAIYCWQNRAASDLFFQRALRDGSSEKGICSSGVGSTGVAASAAHGTGGAGLDFPCFVRRVVFPIGETLAATGKDRNYTPTRADGIESFVERVLLHIEL
jgi:hypothetical protein